MLILTLKDKFNYEVLCLGLHKRLSFFHIYNPQTSLKKSGKCGSRLFVKRQILDYFCVNMRQMLNIASSFVQITPSRKCTTLWLKYRKTNIYAYTNKRGVKIVEIHLLLSNINTSMYTHGDSVRKTGIHSLLPETQIQERANIHSPEMILPYIKTLPAALWLP